MGAAEGIVMRLACLPGPRKLKLWHVPCEATPAGPRLKSPLLIKLHGLKRLRAEFSQEIAPGAHTAHQRKHGLSFSLEANRTQWGDTGVLLVFIHSWEAEACSYPKGNFFYSGSLVSLSQVLSPFTLTVSRAQ